MRRETPSFALLLVGSWILKLALSDDYKMYVKDSFGPWLAVSGGLLVVAAITGLVMTIRGTRVDHAEHADHPDETDLESQAEDHADRHDHRSYVGWLLLAPLLAFTLIAPQPLGAFSAERAAAPPPPPASQSYDALPSGDPVDLTLRDFTSRSLWDGGQTLEGRTVALVGFVTPRPAGGYFVTRLVIACCAADALPVQVFVSGDAPPFASNAWIKVTGVAGQPVRDDTDSFDIASITATSVSTTPPPDSPYEQ